MCFAWEQGGKLLGPLASEKAAASPAKKWPRAARHYGSASSSLLFKRGKVNGVEVGRLESN